MKSSFDETRKRSNYHFDNKKYDINIDKIDYLGKIVGDWDSEFHKVVEKANPITWRNRNPKKSRPEEEYIAEEYDLERAGYGKDYIVSNMSYDVSETFQKISDLFGLENCMARVHVQMPGQIWNWHLDKLEKFNPDFPSSVVRYMIQLNDWEPGQFYEFGNYVYTGWNKGDVTTFDWQNLPHCTANAGTKPRVTLQLTGVVTEKTTEFLKRLKRFGAHLID